MRKFYICLVIVSAIVNIAAAQSQRVIADKIVAQVGDKVILHSDIVNAIADFKRQNSQYIPTECELIENELIQKTLMLQAQKDSLTINEEEVEADIDNRIRYFINTYGSQKTLEEIANKTVYQLKEDFRQSIREGMYAKEMRKKILANVKVSPVEVKKFFDSIPQDSLPYYESELELSQVVIYPKANKDVEEYVSSTMMDMKKQVESGAKSFESLARLYSDDPGSKENGGLYNLNRSEKGMWDPTFLSMAFRLKEGQVSNPFKSKFGIHIMQLVSRTGDDVTVRHILRIPPVTDEEINQSKKVLDSVRSKIIVGSISFSEAIDKYGTDDFTSKMTGGVVSGADGSTFVTIDQLDKEMVASLSSINVGDISQPQTFTDKGGKKGVRIIYLKSRSEPHRENLRDDYTKISARTLSVKMEEAMNDWFTSHIPGYYIRIDDKFKDCVNIEQWNAAKSLVK